MHKSYVMNGLVKQPDRVGCTEEWASSVETPMWPQHISRRITTAERHRSVRDWPS